MKSHFSSLPISYKLKYIITVVSAMALLIASLVYVIAEVFNFQRGLIERITIISDLIEDNIGPSLALDDSESAQRLLVTLHNDSAIMGAFLYQTDAVKPLAQYISQHNKATLLAPIVIDDWKQLKTQQYHFKMNSLEFIKPLFYDNDQIGYIYIKTNLNSLYDNIFFYLKIALCVMSATIGVAFLLSIKLQQRISAPIISLANTMLQVSKAKDYSLRVVKNDADEIGSLFDCFNEMLGQIEERNDRLANYNEELEQQVVTRTMELSTANTDLHLAIEDANKAKDIAESASQAKSEFLAKMSHEIRTPMNGIMGMAELLICSELTKKQQKYTLTIQNSADSLLEIINEILDFSKIEAGHLKLEKIQFNLHLILGEITDFFDERAKSKGLVFYSFLSPELPTMVIGDALRLRQILSNLISNAVKFTDKGQVVISTAIIKECDNEFLIRFEIRDTGIGLAKATRGKIFESFTQEDDSTTRKYGGTGLGLTISKQLVQMMGGDIGIESQLDKGSLFWFTILFTKSELVVLPALLSVQNKIEDIHSLDINILMAEDNLVNQDVTSYMLELIGAKVTVVEDGNLVVEALSKQNFDIILMDCHMPNMDGFDATRSVREYENNHPTRKMIPIIAVTANAMIGDRENCLASGMNDFISKPFKKQALYNILKKWLPNSGQINQTTILSTNLVSNDVHNIILEEKALEELSSLNSSEKPDILDKLLNLYMNKIPSQIEELYQANIDKDPEKIFKISHNVKSSSATIGAVQLAKLAKELEALGRSGSTENTEQLIKDMTINYQQLEPLLKKYLTNY